MFSNGKGNEETQTGHKKSESFRSESTRPFLDDDLFSPVEDAEMLREFDDLMRSTSTMKVSLTPDRLKTMEMYKQEKDRSAIRRPATHFSSNSEPDIPPSSRTNGQRPSLRHVDSIVEDEEEQNLKGRPRQASIATPPAPSLAGVTQTRSRSVSTSSAVRGPVRKPVRAPSVKAAPSSFARASPSPDMVQSRDFRQPKVSDNNGFPPRTRKIQHNRDSMDLDDIMNGSDDDQDVSIPVAQQPRAPSTPRRANPPHAVSTKTRELIDFLAEGPPEPPLSQNGRELMNFLAEGPPDYGSSAISLDTSKPKGAGRLQRMISKLNLGNGEKTKGVSEGPKTPQTRQPQPTSRPNVISPKPSAGTLSSLANRPIPPRPPRPSRPISPPSSPHDSSDENKSMRSPPRRPYQDTSYSREASSVDKSIPEKLTPVTTPLPPVPQSSSLKADNYVKSTPPSNTLNHVNSNGNARQDYVPKEVIADVRPLVPVRTTSVASPVRKPVPAVVSTVTPSISETDVRDMQRLLSSATTADECRLIFEMYMVRNGISREPKAPAVPYPSPSPSMAKHTPYAGGESSLESSLVELFLGGSAALELTSQLPLAQEPRIDGLPVENGASEIDIPQKTVVPPGVSIIQTHQAIPIRA
jgi:hypothetical protein